MRVTADEMWPPGFRFHPTDEELVLFYLKRKICKKRIKFNIIAETDVYKWDPEELPGQSLLKTGDRQWFFFSPRDRKYPNGARSNRATRFGYWKATGRDRNISYKDRGVGVKKTLVFYRGRAPNGDRTDWVMHEYTLDEDELQRCQNVKDYYALYKVFKKSGPGPKNGEQYGAPFVEEDWVDDDCAVVTNPAIEDTPPVNGLNETAPVYNERVTSDDIEELFRQLEAESAQGQIHYPNENFLPEVIHDERAQSTLVNVCSPEVVLPEPVREIKDRSSIDFTQSASSNLQTYEASEVTSAPRIGEPMPELCVEDFLELDDLMGPEPKIYDVEKTVEKVQFDEFAGVLEFDQFHDASMFPNCMAPNGSVEDNLVNHENYLHEAPSMLNQVDLRGQPYSVADQVVHQFQDNPIVNQVNLHYQSNMVVNTSQPEQFLEADDLSSQMWMLDEMSNGFNSAQPDLHMPVSANPGIVQESTNPPASNQNPQEGGDASGWLSSALWSFVDSIPSTPASAAESPLVNRAFERMSSFSRIRLNPKNIAQLDSALKGMQTAGSSSTSSSGNNSHGKNKRFLVLSIFGALFAILWMLMGSMRVLGRSIFSS